MISYIHSDLIWPLDCISNQLADLLFGIDFGKCHDILHLSVTDCSHVLFSYVPVQSPPRIIKQPPTDELLFQVKSRADENDKPFIIECEADGEPAPV